ncbi:MAG: signal recognition particle protein [Planctomycetaceae bacterium]|nr:signal recognition particle protein [Planctomycetaceae bacterium]
MFESLSRRLSAAFQGLRGQKELNESNIEEGLTDVRQALLEADVHFRVGREFVEKVKARALGQAKIADKNISASDQFVAAVHRELVELMGPEDARIEFAKSGPTVILMAGLQGAGKTTTCAKLARHFVTRHQKRPLLVAADVKRPAAVEQLRVLGRRLDVPVYHEAGLTPPELCARGIAEARRTGRDVVLLDTAGRLHVDDELMAEVAEIARRTNPHAQVLVVDGMTGQDAVRSAQAFHEKLSLTGVILTKLDGDARAGAAMSLKAITGRPILFLGTGEKLEDLDAFSAERMAGRILGLGDVVGLVEAASERIDEKEAQASYEKMVMGNFTIEDMLAQLRMIQKLPMKKMLGMLPGVGDMLKDVDMDEKRFKRVEALCTSMTRRERLQPDVIDMSRRRRIAKGAGQDVGAVNELLKSFKGMKQMMKQMGKMGGGRGGMGASQKRAALEAMAPGGELAADLSGPSLLSRAGGMLGGGLRGLGGMFGGGGGLPPGMGGLGGLEGLAGVGGAKPGAGKGAPRDRSKEKAKAKQKRKNRKKR